MQLYLIRHAESENNSRPAYERVEDPGLTSLGRLQADYLAKWLMHLPINELICSPFRRTLQTTKAILDAASESFDQRSLSIWHDVFERGGCFIGHGPEATQGGEGLGRSGILQLLERTAPEVTIDPSITSQGWWGAKNRETDEEAATRAREVIRRIKIQFADSQKCVAIVTHADFIRLLLDVLVGDAVEMERVGLIRNAGITKLNLIDNAWHLDWLNSASHLPPKLC